jgi:CheY-like chemotaxis protein
VDTTRFVQVLSNILQNAVKFTPEGGRILIEGRLAKRPHDGVEELAISVSDSGVGISEDMIGRVFELFTQDDAAAGRSHSGLGIGLALARRLMELHGGTVDVYSDGPGHGSRFTVRIPVARHVEPLAARVTRQRRAAIGQKVLVIDDNLDAANTVALLVESLGNACEVAYDGETGLARALALRPNVILLDIGMPGMDGYQTCRQLRSALGPDVVIVAVTGWGQEQDKDDAYRAGFSAHLTKPADPAALEHLLARGEEPYEPAS